MQKVRIILALITLGCILGPVGAVVLMYRNNLTQMVIPLQIQQAISNKGGNNNNNGNNSSNGNNNNNGNNSNNGSNGNNNSSGNGPNVNLDNADSQINTSTGKITLVFNITNTNSQDEKLSKMSGTVINGQDQVTLGTVSLPSSVTINAGQSSLVTVSGSLTSQGKNDLLTNFAGASSVDIEISGGTMTLNGATQSQSQTQDFGDVSIVS